MKAKCTQHPTISQTQPTRQILAFHVGDRSQERAKRLWDKIPTEDRKPAPFYAGQSAVYRGAIPAAQHQASTKKARKTNHGEWFNNALRQRVSRLARRSLAFAKSRENHIGAI